MKGLPRPEPAAEAADNCAALSPFHDLHPTETYLEEEFRHSFIAALVADVVIEESVFVVLELRKRCHSFLVADATVWAMKSVLSMAVKHRRRFAFFRSAGEVPTGRVRTFPRSPAVTELRAARRPVDEFSGRPRLTIRNVFDLYDFACLRDAHKHFGVGSESETSRWKEKHCDDKGAHIALNVENHRTQASAACRRYGGL